MRRLVLACALAHALSVALPAAAADDVHWPGYHGDLTGQRHSTLADINKGNVDRLALSWVYHAQVPAQGFLKPAIKAMPVEQGGVLYFSMPNHVWAVDARTGREIWHYKTDSGTTIGNRGVALWKDTVLVETPDNHLVSLDASTGKERWRVAIADVRLGYFSSMAPLIVADRVIVAAGGDSLDLAGSLEARDPDSGALLWSWRTTPRAGEPGIETWPDAEAADHGAGMPWLPGTYDAELGLIYWGTGNPNPVHAGQGRKGDNLWTGSIVALDVKTGKLVWHYQVSPHDTHDWDAVQTPVLVDGAWQGQPRRLLIQASRNGHFFVLDRATGEHLLTSVHSEVNWTEGLDAEGRPIPDPAKEPRPEGTLVVPSSGGATNWPPPSFDPASGLLFFSASDTYSLFYLTDTGPRPSGFAGRDEFLIPLPSIKAIDHRTGTIRWKHPFEPGLATSGLLSTAGQVLFAGDSQNNLLALDSATGRTLWHVNLGAAMSNAPMTYRLAGRQYLVVAAGTSLYGFALPRPAVVTAGP